MAHPPSANRPDMTARRLELFVKLGQTLFDANGAWRSASLAGRGLFCELSWQAMVQAREFIRYDGRANLAAMVHCTRSELSRVLRKLLLGPVPLVSLLDDPVTGAERIRVVGIRMLFPLARPWNDERPEFEAWRAQHSDEPVRNSDAIDWRACDRPASRTRPSSGELGATRSTTREPRAPRPTSGQLGATGGNPARKSAPANAPPPDVDVRPRERSISLPPPGGGVGGDGPVDGPDGANGPKDGGVEADGHGPHGHHHHAHEPDGTSPGARLLHAIVGTWELSTSSKAYTRELLARGQVQRFFAREPLTLLAWARGVTRALARKDRGKIRSPWLCLAARSAGRGRSTSPARKDRAWVKAELSRLEAEDG